MEYDESGDDSKKISKYNSGIAQLYRIDNLWKDAHRDCRLGKLNRWNWTLDRVWLELAGDLDEKENEKDKATIKSFNDINNKVADLNTRIIKKSIKVKDFTEKLYQLLMDKELFLRRLQNELGKGSAYQDYDEDDWE